MSRFMDRKYDSLEEYVPGEQPRDMEYIKLNTNESPFPPSPKVLKAITEVEINKLELYPDPECTELIQKLADVYGFEKENIILGNGSDEILDFAFTAFCQNGAAFPDITYGFYEVFGQLRSVDMKIIPLKDDFSVDPEDYKNIGRAVFIANPNAPTGMDIPVSKIEEIVKSNPDNVVIIDEAYVDFGGESAIGLVKKYENILIVRTFSKSRSMAGARLGFAIGSKAVISDLNKIKYSTNPYNINRLTLIAGEASLEDDEYFRKNCAEIINIRKFTREGLIKLGFEVLPSKTNFIFAKSNKMSGERLYKKLREKGIIVRRFPRTRIEDYLRITIGTREQMTVFLDMVKAITNGEE